MEINVIVRDEGYFIKRIFTVKYKKGKYSDLKSFLRYLNDNYKEQYDFIYAEYDIECKKKYLSSLLNKKEELELDTDFDSLEFEKYFNTTDNTLTINTILGLGGWGCASGSSIFELLSFFFFIRDLILSILSLLRILWVILFPFYQIRKNYGYGKEFLYDVISPVKFGFLKLDKIKYNKLLEISVMLRLGYKLKKKMWILRKQPNFYSYKNKYDLY